MKTELFFPFKISLKFLSGLSLLICCMKFVVEIVFNITELES